MAILAVPRHLARTTPACSWLWGATGLRLVACFAPVVWSTGGPRAASSPGRCPAALHLHRGGATASKQHFDRRGGRRDPAARRDRERRILNGDDREGRGVD